MEPSLAGVSVINISYIPNSPKTIFTWLMFLGKLCAATSDPEFKLRLICAWVPNSHFATNIKMKCLSLLKSYIPSSWVVTCSLCHAVNAGDSITADRYVISFIKFIADTTTIVELDCSENQVSTWGFQSCINLESNLKPIMNNFKLPPPIQYIDPKYPLVLLIIHSSAMSAVARMNSSNCFLDPPYPAMEPSPLENINSIFGRRVGIASVDKTPLTDSMLSDCGLIQCYSIPHEDISTSLDNSNYTNWLNNNIPFSISVKLRTTVILNLLNYAGCLDDFVYAESETVDNCQFYHMTASPTTMDWTEAYAKNKSAQIIMPMFDTIAKPS